MLTTAKASLVYKPVDANLPKSVRFPSDVSALQLCSTVCKNKNICE